MTQFTNQYTGICCACFWPITGPELVQFRTSGRKFHVQCALEKKTNYYVHLEKRLARKEGLNDPAAMS